LRLSVTWTIKKPSHLGVLLASSSASFPLTDFFASVMGSTPESAPVFRGDAVDDPAIAPVPVEGPEVEAALCGVLGRDAPGKCGLWESLGGASQLTDVKVSSSPSISFASDVFDDAELELS
jgi:hypothetical protein